MPGAAVLPVRSLGFNLPCRQFSLDAQVARDRWLPVVDEFVLRALFLCERISVKRLASFFGFGTDEMRVVLADLQAASLIVAEQDDVLLHPTALEMFRASGDGVPTLVEVEAFPSRIWFDLVSKSMVPAGPLFAVRNLIEVASGDVAELDSAFATEAFHASFRDYLKRVRKIQNADQWSLYAITHVEAGRFGFAQLHAQEELVLNPSPKLTFSLMAIEEEQTNKVRKLTEAIRAALSHISDPEPSASARTDFARLTKSNLVSQSTKDDGLVDLSAWLNFAAAIPSQQTRVFVGAPYLERNRQAVVKLVLQSREEDGRRNPNALELIWVRPGGTAWGRSTDLQAMLAELREATRVPGARTKMDTMLIAPPSVARETMKSFDRLFQTGHYAMPGLLSTALDVLLVGNLAAVVTVLVPLAPDVNVWIGYASSERVFVKEIKDLTDSLKGDKAKRLWFRSHDAAKIDEEIEAVDVGRSEHPRSD